MTASKADEKTPIATELAKKQKAISVAEFFEKNRHMLGFDSLPRCLITCVKEAVDNSLDACEEASILPDIYIRVRKVDERILNIVVEDNGPGVQKDVLPRVFGKLLYGSRFHAIRQSRGQQGIGISAAVLYAQLTSGKPARITSRIDPKLPAYVYELKIDTEIERAEDHLGKVRRFLHFQRHAHRAEHGSHLRQGQAVGARIFEEYGHREPSCPHHGSWTRSTKRPSSSAPAT